MSDNYITHTETPRTHFIMLPNVIDDMGLSPYAFRLYCHLRRVAGESGACWQSTATLAAHCGISAGSISQAKKDLTDKGLISIDEKSGAGGIYHHITITDVWERNHQHYQPESVHQMNANPKSVHQMNAVRSPGETKNNPYKNNPQREEDHSGANNAPEPAQDALPFSLSDDATVEVLLAEDKLLFAALNENRKAAGQRAMRPRFDSIQQKARWRTATTTAERLYNGSHRDHLAEWVNLALAKGIVNKAGVVAYVAKIAENQVEQKTTPIVVR